MVATYIQKIMRDMNFVTGVCSRQIIGMFLVDEVYGLDETFNVGIISDTI